MYCFQSLIRCVWNVLHYLKHDTCTVSVFGRRVTFTSSIIIMNPVSIEHDIIIDS